MVTTLYLVRHGETEGQEKQCYYGSTDVGLSVRGTVQVEGAAAFIVEHLQAPGRDGRNGSDCTLAAVYCSGLKRAIDSAGVIAGPQGLKPIEIPDLGERSFGLWEGLTFEEIENNHPEGFALWLADPLTYSPEGGENAWQVRERAIRSIELVVARHRGANLSVVAHGGVNRIIIGHLLGMPLENIFRLEQDYGAVNIIEFWDAYPVVKLMNHRPGADREQPGKENRRD